MSNVLLCQGRYAENPYYVKDDCKNLYSIEELCYYLYHNAFLLDDGFVEKSLAEWMDSELELKELARKVAVISGRTGALIRLIEILAEQIGYYSEPEWRELLNEVGANNSLSVEERRKCRADAFLQAGRIGMAMNEYEIILRQTRVTETKLRAKVLHNLGVCSARLFMFKQAAGYFEKAYDTYANTESYVDMLTAMKLYMSRQEYLDYLSEHKESYEDSLEVERRVDGCVEEFKTRASSLYLQELGQKQGKPYYDGIDILTEEVKEKYRESVARGRAGGF